MSYNCKLRHHKNFLGNQITINTIPTRIVVTNPCEKLRK